MQEENFPSDLPEEIRKSLDRFIGQKLNSATAFDVEQTILATLHSSLRGSVLEHIDFEVTVVEYEGRVKVTPKNLFTALYFVGIKAPPPPFLGETFQTENGIYSFDGKNLHIYGLED